MDKTTSSGRYGQRVPIPFFIAAAVIPALMSLAVYYTFYQVTNSWPDIKPLKAGSHGSVSVYRIYLAIVGIACSVNCVLFWCDLSTIVKQLIVKQSDDNLLDEGITLLILPMMRTLGLLMLVTLCLFPASLLTQSFHDAERIEDANRTARTMHAQRVCKAKHLHFLGYAFADGDLVAKCADSNGIIASFEFVDPAQH